MKEQRRRDLIAFLRRHSRLFVILAPRDRDRDHHEHGERAAGEDHKNDGDQFHSEASISKATEESLDCNSASARTGDVPGILVTDRYPPFRLGP